MVLPNRAIGISSPLIETRDTKGKETREIGSRETGDTENTAQKGCKGGVSCTRLMHSPPTNKRLVSNQTKLDVSFRIAPIKENYKEQSENCTDSSNQGKLKRIAPIKENFVVLRKWF
mmetsp:Transcript_22798/g.44280  ORF Transcript_22798/g.44280 Transcript_22798/m.44280 type:complete len:117 (-) Transcript_22798:276-626(-)